LFEYFGILGCEIVGEAGIVSSRDWPAAFMGPFWEVVVGTFFGKRSALWRSGEWAPGMGAMALAFLASLLGLALAFGKILAIFTPKRQFLPQYVLSAPQQGRGFRKKNRYPY